MVLLQLIGVQAALAAIYRDIGLKLPVLTHIMLGVDGGPLLTLGLGAAAVWALFAGLGLIRGLRHLCHVWWVDVHRQAALHEIACAAAAGADARCTLSAPWSWLAIVRLSAWRQDRPSWDRAWRTWRFLTRLRALGPGWRVAARATTAAGVLAALGLLGTDADHAALVSVRDEVRARLAIAVEGARIQAWALMSVCLVIGLMFAILALLLPLLSLGGSL